MLIGSIMFGGNIAYTMFFTDPSTNRVTRRIRRVADCSVPYFYVVALLQWVVSGHQIADESRGNNTASFLVALIGWLAFSYGVLAVWPIRERVALSKVTKTYDENAIISFGCAVVGILEEKALAKNHFKLAGAFADYGSKLSKLDEMMLKRILNPSYGRLDNQLGSTALEKQDELDWYRFLLIVLQEAASKNPKSEQIKLLIAYICYHKLDKKWQAIYCLLSAKKMNPTLLQECSIRR